MATLARTVAADAASLVIADWDRYRHTATSKSSATDPVTEADRRSEQLIRDRLAAARPGDRILGEEGGPSEGGPSEGDRSLGTGGAVRAGVVRWLVDPIDGTVNFVYGIPGFAVSIGAEIDGEMVAGVVVDCTRGDEYWAAAGEGAWCNGERIAVTRVADPALALVGTGFAYLAERRAHQGAVVGALLPQVRDIRRFGSAALDLCFVARGRLDAYYEAGLGPWDLAAGGLIAREAGAVVTDFRGGPAGPHGCLAAGPELHIKLRAVLVGCGVESPLFP